MKYVRKYRIEEIQKVYERFHDNPNSVVMSLNDGYTWYSPPMDTEKWLYAIHTDMLSTVCWAFLETR